MYSRLINKNHRERILASALLFALFTNLLIGGIFWPRQQAQANVPTIDATLAAAAAAQKGQDAAWWSWDKITEAARNGQMLQLVGKALWDKAEYIAKEAMKVAWNILRKKLLNMIVNDIVKWIQDGSTPRFITDWQGFMKTAADKAAGQLLEEMGGGWLCSKFSLQLRLALSTPPKFDETATCTLSAAIANIDKFMDGFENGGWAGFIKISESQNNYMGAYYLAIDRKKRIEAEAAEAKKNESAAGGGYLGDTVCVSMFNKATNDTATMPSYQGYKEANIPAGYKCTKWESRTPGQAIAGSMQQAMGVDIENLISAKEFAEYAGAIIDAVINRVAKEGLAMLSPSPEGASVGKTGPGINTPATVPASLSSLGLDPYQTYQHASSDKTELSSLGQQQRLLKENNEKLIDEKRLNLEVLNKIKTQRITNRSILDTILNEDCDLPSGASTATTDAQIADINTQIITINAEITAAQATSSKITTTNTDTNDYLTSINTYLPLYEAWQKGDLTAATSTAVAAMETARQKAVASNQKLLSSSSAKFSEFGDETMQASANTVNQINNTSAARGISANCAYSGSTGLYDALCADQNTGTSYTSYYNSTSCLYRFPSFAP